MEEGQKQIIFGHSRALMTLPQDLCTAHSHAVRTNAAKTP